MFADGTFADVRDPRTPREREDLANNRIAFSSRSRLNFFCVYTTRVLTRISFLRNADADAREPGFLRERRPRTARVQRAFLYDALGVHERTRQIREPRAFRRVRLDGEDDTNQSASVSAASRSSDGARARASATSRLSSRSWRRYAHTSSRRNNFAFAGGTARDIGEVWRVHDRRRFQRDSERYAKARKREAMDGRLMRGWRFFRRGADGGDDRRDVSGDGRVRGRWTSARVREGRRGDARDRARRVRHGNLRVRRREICLGREARFFLGSPSRRRTSRETTRASRTPPFFSCATTSGVTRSTATPRSDLILPRSSHQHQAPRLEVTEAGEGGASQSDLLLSLAPHHLTRSRFFEGSESDVSSKGRFARASQRSARVSSAYHGDPREFMREASARRARRSARAPCPRFVTACCAGGPPEISRAPQRPDESFVWFETSRAPASRRVFHV